MKNKSCNRCKWLKKYSSASGHYMYVCEGEEADDQGDGLFLITAIDTEEFNASLCLIYKEATDEKSN